MNAENENYVVKYVRSNALYDIYSVYNRNTGEKRYQEFSRSSGVDAEDVLSTARF